MQQVIVELPKPAKVIAVYSPLLPIGETTVPLPVAPPIEDNDLLAGIGKPRRAILKALSAYYYLTAEQLTRLLFSPTSYTYVNKHLQFLIKNQLVEWLVPAKQL